MENKLVKKVNSIEDIKIAKRTKLMYQILFISLFIISTAVLLFMIIVDMDYHNIPMNLAFFIYLISIITCGMSISYIYFTTKMLPKENN